MKKAKILFITLMVPALMVVSCKKDDPPTPPPYKQPVTASMGEVVVIPTGLEAKANAGSDPGASMAVSYIGLANAFSSFGGYFAVPEGAQVQSKKDGLTVYYWAYGDLKYWMTYGTSGDKYTWKYEYEYTGHPRFTYIYAEEALNGKSGNWAIYDPETPVNDIWTYNWSYNASNSLIANLVAGNNEFSFDVVANTNNSGSFKYYVASVLTAEVIWNADGSGTYTFYGDLSSYSGSWTAK